jgi:hypothetical protein
MLDRPLRDMFEAATVREVEQGEGQRALRKTIAVFQGVTARRAEGLMRYEGSVSVTAEEFEAVHANIAGGLDALQSTFKGRLQNVELSVSQPPETTVVGDADAAVELAHHEAPARHGGHRETDRDVLGSASTDA